MYNIIVKGQRRDYLFVDEDNRSEKRPESFQRFVVANKIASGELTWIRAVYCRTREDFDALLEHWNCTVYDRSVYTYVELTDH